MIGRSSSPRPAAAVAVACVALFTDMLVYGLAIPVLPLLPATVEAGSTATGVLFACYAAAMIVVTPIAGRLVDRVGPGQPLLIGLFGLAAATLLFAVGAPYWLLLIARAVQGVAAGMSWVAGMSLIAAVTPLATRGRSMGLAMSMVSMGLLIGPPLAGFLVENFDVTAPFLFAAALALAAGVARLMLVRNGGPVTDDLAGPLSVLRVPGSWAVVGAVVLGAGTLAAVEPVLPLHLTQQFDTGALGIGLLFAVAVVGGAVANPLVGGLVGRVDARVLVGIGVLTSALALAGLAVSQHSWHVGIGMVVLGGSNAFFLAPATLLIGVQGMNSRPPALGGAYALFIFAYASGLALGPLFAGAGTDLAGFTVAMCVLAALVAVLGAANAARLPNGLHPRRKLRLPESDGLTGGSHPGVPRPAEAAEHGASLVSAASSRGAGRWPARRHG
jgi:MFS transporter, DHA1 family, solute carrier family 18 (vesicular amine transporter), member 1/2